MRHSYGLHHAGLVGTTPMAVAVHHARILVAEHPAHDSSTRACVWAGWLHRCVARHSGERLTVGCSQPLVR